MPRLRVLALRRYQQQNGFETPLDHRKGRGSTASVHHQRRGFRACRETAMFSYTRRAICCQYIFSYFVIYYILLKQFQHSSIFVFIAFPRRVFSNEWPVEMVLKIIPRYGGNGLTALALPSWRRVQRRSHLRHAPSCRKMHITLEHCCGRASTRCQSRPIARVNALSPQGNYSQASTARNGRCWMTAIFPAWGDELCR